MVRVYLYVSTYSVQVELLFSTDELILNSRSFLASYRMNIVCFIHENYDVVPT